jgi:hypothetical protein
MTPAQRKTLAEIHKTGTTGLVQTRTLEALLDRGYIVKDGPQFKTTKKGARIVENRAGGNLAPIKKKDLRAHFKSRKPAKAKRDRATTAREKQEHLSGLQKHHEAAEKKRRMALGRILGPSGHASAVKVAKADGSAFTAQDVKAFLDAGWTVTGAASVAARPGTSGVPGVQFREDDWTFKNPEPIGPNGTARALILVGRIDAATVDELSAHGYDVTAAPKKLREATIRNPGPHGNTKPRTGDRFEITGSKATGFVLWVDGQIVCEAGSTKVRRFKTIQAARSVVKRFLDHYTTRNPAPAIQKQVYQALKTAFGKRVALRPDEVAEKLKKPESAVMESMARLLELGLIHEAGRDLFGPCYAPGAPARGLFDNPSPAAKATKKARAWFQDESLVTAAQEIDWTPPDSAVHIGQFVAVEYLSDKFDGVKRIYRHEVTKVRQMLLSPDGSTIIVDPPFKITKRGIEG